MISVGDVASPTASVVVRAKDSAATIEATLADIRGQTVPLEVVVVDAGSTDGTLEIARRAADRVVEISRYRPGYALNQGTRAASGEVVFAVSSHCRMPHDDWAERALSHYADPQVAGVSSSLTTPGGDPLTAPYSQRKEDVSLNPYWGFSNHASSWRRAVWEELPFHEESLIEDKEWAIRVLDAGHKLIFDPYLWVEQHHRWRAGTISYYQRERREMGALAGIVSMPPYRIRDVAREWLTRPDEKHSRLFHLLNYRRAAGLLGKYAGIRRTQRDAGQR